MSWSVAGPGDIDSVSACIAEAFASDPIWSIALARADGGTNHHEPYWRNFVEGAMRFGTVHRWKSGAAVSVWVPPGESELTPELEQVMEALLQRYLDAENTITSNGCAAMPSWTFLTSRSRRCSGKS